MNWKKKQILDPRLLRFSSLERSVFGNAGKKWRPSVSSWGLGCYTFGEAVDAGRIMGLDSVDLVLSIYNINKTVFQV